MGRLLAGLIALVAAQLAGEFLVTLLQVPVPGTILGLLLMLIYLLVRRPPADAPVLRAADTLLAWMPVFFIAPSVGVITYLALFAESGWTILGAIVVSWLAALLATVGSAALLLRLQARRKRAAR